MRRSKRLRPRKLRRGNRFMRNGVNEKADTEIIPSYDRGTLE